MSDDIRINLHLPAAAGVVIERLCRERRVARTTLVRQALGILEAVHDAAGRGRYVGTTSDPGQLETVIIGPV